MCVYIIIIIKNSRHVKINLTHSRTGEINRFRVLDDDDNDDK